MRSIMANESPLRKRHQAYSAGRLHRPHDAADRPGAASGHQAAPIEVEFIKYAAPGSARDSACELVGTFGDLEAEYAAIRRGAGLLDSPHRGTIVVTGADRLSVLNNLLTQELKDLTAGRVKCSFWLNRKGRIDADLMLVETAERLVIDVDTHRTAETVKALSEYVFTEDAAFSDESERWHHIAVHGPAALDAIAAAANQEAVALDPGQSANVSIADADVIVARCDVVGETGLALFVPIESVDTVWQTLVATEASIPRVRPIGWHAFNIARIEAGTPLFNVDFGTTNLPHETAILAQRVSFTKGCYLGQEIVARMESLGKPKRCVVGIRVQSDVLPVAGAQIFECNDDDAMGAELGVVTSSTLSPMLGAQPIAFGMMKSRDDDASPTVLIAAEGELARATVMPELCFLGAPRPVDEKGANV